MKLSDIMSAAGLSIYAEIALVIFLAVFVGVLVYVFSPSRRKAFDDAARMPLDDERPRDPRA